MTGHSAISQDATPLNDFLCFSLYSANHAMHRVYKTVLADLGLTYPQYLVLVLLWDRDGQLVGDLGRGLHLDSNTLTPLLKRLEAMGHVTRRRDTDDERQVRVRLTDQGRALREDAACVPDQIVRTTGLSDADIRDLNAKILALRSHLADNAEA